MAAPIPFQRPLLRIFAPVQPLRQPFLSNPAVQRILNGSIPVSLPFAAFAGVSDVLREIWDGLLRAVPKKKTSHMKKRHRQMAGKAVKDVTHLSRCSACGRLKRAHVLCPYCVQAVRLFVKEKVTGMGKFQLPQAPGRPMTTYNAAETAPGVWEALKRKWKKRAEAEKKERKDDKTKW